MKINVFYDREKKNKIIKINANSLVKDLLVKMDINPVTVIVSKDGSIITEDEELKDKEEIRIISVISGG